MNGTVDELVLRTDAPQDTFALGREIGRRLVGGMVLGLVGPLGAGKTQLVKGLAFGNADDHLRDVTSPTFTLVQEYAGRLTLYHLDAHRLHRPAEFVALGVDELIRTDSAVVIEWADRVRGVLPEDVLWVELTPVGEMSRDITLRATSARAAPWLRILRGIGR